MKEIVQHCEKAITSIARCWSPSLKGLCAEEEQIGGRYFVLCNHKPERKKLKHANQCRGAGSAAGAVPRPEIIHLICFHICCLIRVTLHRWSSWLKPTAGSCSWICRKMSKCFLLSHPAVARNSLACKWEPRALHWALQLVHKLWLAHMPALTEGKGWSFFCFAVLRQRLSTSDLMEKKMLLA